jgi:hypothetical protein
MPQAQTQLPTALQLLAYLDSKVRADRRPPAFAGRLCVGVPTPKGPRWWVANFGERATTSFLTARPERFDVALAIDDDGARRIFGLPAEGPGLQLVSGSGTFLKRFVRRYLGSDDARASSWLWSS